MHGDKILVQGKHRKAAAALAQILFPLLRKMDGRYAISIGGESGSGKSELAVALAESLEEDGIGTIIIQQDDYFVYPPETNDTRRREDINHVGLAEVRLGLLDDHVKAIINGARMIEKPLVVYQDNHISHETLPLDGVDVMIVEGTYTTLLKNVHSRIFIDQTYKQTTNARLKRDREPSDPFLERVLEIEHGIISTHRYCADIIITASFAVVRSKRRGEPCDSPRCDGSLSKEVINKEDSHRARV
ncbi:MAG: zeta toxin family protein [Candidatus Bipolaricaulota bacterium]|nr:zeta toxin family protein [Candidatus Bipolaricaulota bacterium]